MAWKNFLMSVYHDSQDRICSRFLEMVFTRVPPNCFWPSLEATSLYRRKPQSFRCYFRNVTSMIDGGAFRLSSRSWRPEKQADVLRACSATFDLITELCFPSVFVTKVAALSQRSWRLMSSWNELLAFRRAVPVWPWLTDVVCWWPLPLTRRFVSFNPKKIK